MLKSKKAVITVFFTELQRQKYIAHAESEGETLSTFVRRALKEQMKDEMGACAYRKQVKSLKRAARIAEIEQLEDARIAASEAGRENDTAPSRGTPSSDSMTQPQADI